LQRYVPAPLFDRPKMGFGVPIGDWLRGPLREWADTLLAAKRIEAGGHFDAKSVRRLWDEHCRGTRNWQYQLWILLMFEAWREKEDQHRVVSTINSQDVSCG
jgi:asparagine synthase (glutamine-hydrolysing)